MEDIIIYEHCYSLFVDNDIYCICNTLKECEQVLAVIINNITSTDIQSQYYVSNSDHNINNPKSFLYKKMNNSIMTNDFLVSTFEIKKVKKISIN